MPSLSLDDARLTQQIQGEAAFNWLSRPGGIQWEVRAVLLTTHSVCLFNLQGQDALQGKQEANRKWFPVLEKEQQCVLLAVGNPKKRRPRIILVLLGRLVETGARLVKTGKMLSFFLLTDLYNFSWFRLVCTGYSAYTRQTPTINRF